MDLQSLAHLSQANKALAEVMQHCLTDAPKDELQKVKKVNRKLVQIVCHMTSAFAQIYDAFVEDDELDLGSYDSWPCEVSRDMVSEINNYYDLETLKKTVSRPMTDKETQRFLEGDDGFIFTPEDKAKTVEHLLQYV